MMPRAIRSRIGRRGAVALAHRVHLAPPDHAQVRRLAQRRTRHAVEGDHGLGEDGARRSLAHHHIAGAERATPLAIRERLRACRHWRAAEVTRRPSLDAIRAEATRLRARQQFLEGVERPDDRLATAGAARRRLLARQAEPWSAGARLRRDDVVAERDVAALAAWTAGLAGGADRQPRLVADIAPADATPAEVAEGGASGVDHARNGFRGSGERYRDPIVHLNGGAGAHGRRMSPPASAARARAISRTARSASKSARARASSVWAQAASPSEARRR